MKNSEAIIGAFDVAKRIRGGSLTRTAGIEDLHQRFGMNRSSASGAFSNIAHMLKGEPYKRTMNAIETEHFLQMIHRDYGTDGLRKAVASVEKHIRYYEGLPKGKKLLNIWQIVHKYRDIARDQREPVAVDIPPAVRLLPMNPEEPEFRGKSRDAVQQDFFLNTMPFAPNPGRYQYRERGLDAEPGTVVLFQFKAQIIASAVLVRRERYRERAGPYNGALWFEPGSIRVFSSIGADSVRKHWPEKFTEFGQGMQKLEPPSRYPAFEQELSGIKRPASPTPQGDAAAETLEADPGEVEAFRNQIERESFEVPDSTATVKTRGSAQKAFADAVKANYGYRCAITGILTKNFLVAAHIVPWSKDQSIRLDPSNGICLSLLVDRAFEKGYLLIEDDHSIRIDWDKVGDDHALRSGLEPYEGLTLNAPAEGGPKLEYLQRRRALVVPTE